MHKRIKLAILTLLGFSTACSTVKNASKGEPASAERADTTAFGGSERPKIVVMYGVRPPVEEPLRDAPVLKVPQQTPASEAEAGTGAGTDGETTQSDC